MLYSVTGVRPGTRISCGPYGYAVSGEIEREDQVTWLRASGYTLVDASQDLPKEIAALVQPQSGMRRLGAALGAIGRRPRAAVDMWRLWEHAVVDGRTLAGAIKTFLEGLSDSPSAVSRPGSSPDRP